MRFSQAYAYLEEKRKPDAERKLKYTHIEIPLELEERRRELVRAKKRTGEV